MKDHNDNNNDNKEEEEEDKLETIIHDEKTDVKVTSDDVKEAIIDKPLSSVMESGGTNLDAEASVLGAVAISPSAQALPRSTWDVSFDGRNDEVDSYWDGENMDVMMEVGVPTRENKCAIGQNEIERYVAEMHQNRNCLDDDDSELLIPEAFLVDDNPDDAVIVVDGQVRNV